MLSTLGARATLLVLAVASLASCSASSVGRTSVADAVAEVSQRQIRFPNYPQSDWTYLSFSHAHGFQVNYFGRNGKAWLWYPGNASGVPEEWKLDRVGNARALCFRHPSHSYNPVTRKSGGAYACQSLSFSQKTIVARLKGDPYRLASGAVPYRLDRCKAPAEFEFDRERFGC